MVTEALNIFKDTAWKIIFECDKMLWQNAFKEQEQHKGNFRWHVLDWHKSLSNNYHLWGNLDLKVWYWWDEMTISWKHRDHREWKKIVETSSS